MWRKAIVDLGKWKNSIDRKPLILRGARQVGKTWLMKDFAKKNYKHHIYINFDEDVDIGSIFKSNKDPRHIMELLSVAVRRIIQPETTLIILDEIQECPEALNSLKYFYEQANEYHIIAAGSMLGTLLAQPKSYPVGMVDLLDIHPLDFSEFLRAADENLYNYYLNISLGMEVEEIFHNRLLEFLDYYYIVGGMPECVMAWTKDRNLVRVTHLQKNLLTLYEGDFSKYNGKINSGRILMVFRSIVSQLAKPNEKFMYGAIRNGARARDFEEAIEWLVSDGILERVYNVSQVKHPLTAYAKLDHFKLFMFDTGLLKVMAGTDNGAILLHKSFQFKGPLTENFVLQQLRAGEDVLPYYYADKTMELDFVVQSKDVAIPVEVKAGEDKSSPSFKRFLKENPEGMGLRYSRRGLLKNGQIINLPLYLAGREKVVLENANI